MREVERGKEWVPCACHALADAGVKGGKHSFGADLVCTYYACHATWHEHQEDPQPCIAALEGGVKSRQKRRSPVYEY